MDFVTQGSGKHILILVAMDVEEKAILGQSKWKSFVISDRLGISAKIQQIGDNSVSVVKTGVGPVHAGIALAMYAENFLVTEVVLLGVGGSLTNDVHPGETVLATSIIQHDCLITRDGNQDGNSELMAPGELFLSVSPEQRISPVMPTQSSLTDLLEASIHPKPHRGGILSGNEFVGSKLRKSELKRKHPGALLVEMEAAGIAQVARKLSLPLAVAKTVADGFEPKGSISEEYLNWIDSSAEKAHQVVAALTTSL